MTKSEVLTPAWMESVVVGAGLVTIMLPVSTQLENIAVLAIVFILSWYVQEVLRSKGFEQSSEMKFRPHSCSGLLIGNLLIPMVTSSSLSSSTNQDTPHFNVLFQSLVLYVCVLTPLVLLGCMFLKLKPATEYRFHHHLWILAVVGLLAWALFQPRYNVATICIFLVTVSLTVYFFFTRLLYFLPGSFTLGEAVFVSESLTLLTALSASSLMRPITHLFACLQVLILGCVVIGLAVIPVAYQLLKHPEHHPPCEGQTPKGVAGESEIRADDWAYVKLSLYFYLCVASTIILILLPWLGYFLGQQPLLWGLYFVTATRLRMALLCVWAVLVMGAVGVVLLHQSSSTIVRKYFHILAICIYVPGILYDVDLLYLASAGTVFIFILLEMLRVFRVWPVGGSLHSAFLVFLDDQDSGVAILTHIYLLLGMSIPVWVYTGTVGNSHQGSSLALYSGVLSLGVGDTAASIFGSLYGKTKWPGSKKTVEGTCAACMSQLLGCYILHCLDPRISPPYVSLNVVWAVGLISILEAVTTQIDNLVLPIFMYALLIRL
ncbi:uncharacterized protein [Asterias amurensis]|uniref:uncharacterized protein n=1 Tax=Asterias amurensis TaxID=7602 RepID=UPI003AB56103